jgi:hypothetical protein
VLSASLYPACPELRGEPRGVRYHFPRFSPAGVTLLGSLASRRPLPYLPLESTLAKVYQNKQLYLPLESTLVKNPGEGVPIRTSAKTERMRRGSRCPPAAGRLASQAEARLYDKHKQSRSPHQSND